jgi:hypothetical protein
LFVPGLKRLGSSQRVGVSWSFIAVLRRNPKTWDVPAMGPRKDKATRTGIGKRICEESTLFSHQARIALASE